MASQRERQDVRRLQDRQEEPPRILGEWRIYKNEPKLYHNPPSIGVYAGPLPGLDRGRLRPGAVPAELLLGGGARGVPLPVGRGRRQRSLLRVAGPAHLSPAANHQVGYIVLPKNYANMRFVDGLKDEKHLSEMGKDNN